MVKPISNSKHGCVVIHCVVGLKYVVYVNEVR